MKIAIVENDKKDVELLIDYLNKYFLISKKTEGMKLRLFTYLNGLDFLESSETFDVVFMDIVMPEKSGVEALIDILASDSSAKVVMASSVGTQDNLKIAIAAGAYEFLQKPVNFDDVTKIIEKIAERK